MMLFEQGELIEMDFDPTVGHEPNKMRPALVVSVGHFNNVVSSLTVVCPITSNDLNRHPLHIPIEAGEVRGRVCIEQLRTVDLNNPRCHAHKLETWADEETMGEVLDAIGAVFGI